MPSENKIKKVSPKKAFIIVKAAKLFREKGYAATSMRDLAEDVGVEAASLYNHIQSKAEILQEICFNVANMLLNQLDELEKSNLSAIDKIKALLKYHLDHMIHNYDNAQVADREWRHLQEPYLSNYKEQRKNYRHRLGVILDDGIQQKLIKPIDTSTAVLIMLHAISGIESWHKARTKISAEELEKNMITILVDGLKY